MFNFNEDVYSMIVDELSDKRKEILTVEDISEMLGVTRQSIWNFESKSRYSIALMLEYMFVLYDQETLKREICKLRASFIKDLHKDHFIYTDTDSLFLDKGDK